MKDDIPFSEFAQYPEMTEAQKEVMASVGIALFGIHTAEAYLRFVLSYIFPADEGTTWQNLFAEDQRRSKETLGRMLSRLRKQANVDPAFEEMLSRFLSNRNRFVHGLLVEQGFNPGDDAGITTIQKFLSELEFDSWYVTAILRGYTGMFLKVLGVDNVDRTDITSINNHKYFTHVINFKERNESRSAPSES